MATATGTDSVRNLTYRQLQALAISLEIPGNLKHDVMVALIEAKKSGDEETVKNILLSHKDSQQRRRMTMETTPRGTRRGRGGRRGGGSIGRNVLPSLLPYPQYQNGFHQYHMNQQNYLYNFPAPIQEPNNVLNFPHVRDFSPMPSGSTRSTCLDTASSGNATATPHSYQQMQVNMAHGQLQETSPQLPLRPPMPQTPALSPPSLRQPTLPPTTSYLAPDSTEMISMVQRMYSTQSTVQPVNSHQQNYSPGNYFAMKDYTNPPFYNQSESYFDTVGSNVLTPSSTVDSGVDSPDVYQQRHANQLPERSSCCYAGRRYGYQDRRSNMHMRTQDTNNNLSMNINLIAQNTAMIRHLQMPATSQYQAVAEQYFHSTTGTWNRSSSTGNTVAATTSTFSGYGMEPLCSTSGHVYSPQNSDTVSITDSLPSVENLLSTANNEQMQILQASTQHVSPFDILHQQKQQHQQQQQQHHQQQQQQQQQQAQSLDDLFICTSESNTSTLSTEGDLEIINSITNPATCTTDQTAMTGTLTDQKPIKLEMPDLVWCQYHIYGCFMQMEKHNIRDHERKCRLQSTSCPLIQCLWHGVLQRLTAHLFEAHGSDIIQSIERRIPLSLHQLHMHSRLQFLQSVSGRIFLVNIACVNETIFANMQYIDEGRDGRSFGTLEMLKNNGKTRVWQGPVRPYHEGTAHFSEENFFIAKIDEFMRMNPFIIHARVSHFIKKVNECPRKQQF